MNNDNPVSESFLSLDDGAAAIEGMLGDDDDFEQYDDAPEAAEETPLSDEPDEALDAPSDDAGEDDVEAEGDTPEAEDDGPAIESLADLAEALEMSEEDVLANLRAKIVVDGEQTEVTLAELRAGYQKDADYRRKTGELAEQRRAFEAESQQAAAQYQAQLIQMGQYLNEVEQMMLAGTNEAEMEQLRQSNPAEWVARQQELAAQKERLAAYRQQAANAYQQAQQQQAQVQYAQLAQVLEREQQALTERIPNWSNDLKAEINTFLQQDYGFTEQDLSSVYDSRLVQMAHDAMQYRRMNAKGEVAAKKVKAKPKLQKPGKAKAASGIERSQFAKASARLKKTGSLRDAAAALENLI